MGHPSEAHISIRININLMQLTGKESTTLVAGVHSQQPDVLILLLARYSRQLPPANIHS